MNNNAHFIDILDHLQNKYLLIDFSFFNLLKKFSDIFLILEITFLFVTGKERNIASFSRNFCKMVGHRHHKVQFKKSVFVHGIDMGLVLTFFIC